jgi:hypothetical protein
MTAWRVRDFHDDDLDAAIRLWDDPIASPAAPVRAQDGEKLGAHDTNSPP